MFYICDFFSPSLFTFLYVFFLEKSFSKKHPFLKDLSFFCSIIVIASLVIFFKILIFKLKNILDFFLKINRSESYNNYCSTVNPSNNFGPTNSGGSGGGVNNHQSAF